MNPQPKLPAVNRCGSHVIRPARSEGDHGLALFGHRLAEQEFELANLVATVGFARNIISLDEERANPKQPGQTRQRLDRRGKSRKRDMRQCLGSREVVVQWQAHRIVIPKPMLAPAPDR